MNARYAVLQALADDDDQTLTETEIHDAVDSRARKVDAALQGLVSEDVVAEHSGFGESFYSVAPDTSKRDLKQAMRREGAGEIAEDIIEQSGMLGDPENAERNRSDIFEHLL